MLYPRKIPLFRDISVNILIRCDTSYAATTYLLGLRHVLTPAEILVWCREGESNPHDLAIAGF